MEKENLICLTLRYVINATKATDLFLIKGSNFEIRRGRIQLLLSKEKGSSRTGTIERFCSLRENRSRKSMEDR